ncbi:MAG: hypothetical protein L3J59_10265 [Methylococcaceae bacterium]|nr:hypothetical protein [Methylococcaceae bacterium]
MNKLSKKTMAIAFALSSTFVLETSLAMDNSLTRDFKLPIPLFSETSAWRQHADNVAVLPTSSDIILTTYRVLLGNKATVYGYTETGRFPQIWLASGDWSYPIYRASNNKTDIQVCMYNGQTRKPDIVFGDLEPGATVSVDAPAGTIRPAGENDGHLVLFNPETNTEWDYWQVTTARDSICGGGGRGGIEGNTLLEVGAATFFDTNASGASAEGQTSAAASGAPLMAGLLLPEDFESDEIGHALKFSIPGPRNLSDGGLEKEKRDYEYPATSTEDVYGGYNSDINAMVMGTRIRLKDSLVDHSGNTIDESTLSLATRKVLTALRKHGAYLVDGGGGFTFYAEETHSGNLNSDSLNVLLGDTPSLDGQTPWQILMSTVQNELGGIPIAYGPNHHDGDPSEAIISHANFEVVEFANETGHAPVVDAPVVDDSPQQNGLVIPMAIAPQGEITELSPSYQWNAVANATSYTIGMENSFTETGWREYTITSAEANCTNATQVCNYTPQERPPSGENLIWWVKASNEDEETSYSVEGLEFKVVVSDELIIDDGRGVINGSHTEHPNPFGN